MLAAGNVAQAKPQADHLAVCDIEAVPRSRARLERVDGWSLHREGGYRGRELQRLDTDCEPGRLVAFEFYWCDDGVEVAKQA